MFERFTEPNRKVMLLARQEAHRLGAEFIGTEHLLLGLVLGGGAAARILSDLNVDRKRIVDELQRRIAPSTDASPGFLPFSPRARRAIVLSEAAASSLGKEWIDTEHVLLGLLKEGEGIAAQVLNGLGLEFDRVARKILAPDVHSMPDLRLERRLEGACGVCLQPLSGEGLVSCSRCGALYHPDCWDYNRRRCAMFGCARSEAPSPGMPANDRGVPTRANHPPPQESMFYRDAVMITIALLLITAWCFIFFRTAS